MLLTTTNNIEGKHITCYYGIVSQEVIIGANAIKDMLASMRDFFGGRSKSYEKVLHKGKEAALKEIANEAAAMGANAVIAIDLDYETINNMLMVTATGTAVKIE